MKHRLRNSIILLLVTGIMLYLLLKDNFNSIMEVLTSVNPVWIIFAIVIYLIYFVTDTIPFYIYSHNYNNKLRFPFMLYLNAITKFFNGITPLATGGQPMQVYELRKKGTSTANSTNAVTQFYIVFQISLVLWGLIALLFDKAFGMIEMNTVLNIFTILGFVLNIIVLIFLFVISFNKSINKSIVRVIITFLAKLKIVREKEKQIDKWNTTCDEFYENSKVLKENKLYLFLGITLQMATLFFYHLIPYALARSIGIYDFTIGQSIVCSAYIYLTGCYIPIPGSTGGTEYVFLGFIGNFIFGFKLNALLLLWRTLTYYLPTILGGVALNLRSLKK